MKTIQSLVVLLLFSTLIFVGCGEKEQANSNAGKKAKVENKSSLSAFELENGIGPIKEPVVRNELNKELAEKGGEIFEMKCSACHKVDQRYIGPELGNVLERRTPAYVMNMILNPNGMVKEHPVAKKLLQEYLSPMPNQGLSKEEARAIVEYLASSQD
jgi:mono/diheme cytochrome c family protein